MKRRDDGAAAVEMAIILPLMLLLVFGIIDFGRMLNAQIEVSAAAREGARWAAMGQTGVPARAALAAPNLSGMSTSVTACPATPALTSNATVVTTYTFQFITPFGNFKNFFGGPAGASTKTLTGRGVMRCGG